jgi:hypothetical protein
MGVCIGTEGGQYIQDRGSEQSFGVSGLDIVDSTLKIFKKFADFGVSPEKRGTLEAARLTRGRGHLGCIKIFREIERKA